MVRKGGGRSVFLERKNKSSAGLLNASIEMNYLQDVKCERINTAIAECIEYLDPLLSGFSNDALD